MTRHPSYIPISESALRILNEEGWDTKEQAAAFGASPETVRRRCRGLGIPAPRRRKEGEVEG